MWALDFLLMLPAVLCLVQLAAALIRKHHIIVCIDSLSLFLCLTGFYFGYDYLAKSNIEKSKTLVVDFIANPRKYDVTYDDASILPELESFPSDAGRVHLVSSFPVMASYEFQIEASRSRPFIVQITWVANKPRLFA